MGRKKRFAPDGSLIAAGLKNSVKMWNVESVYVLKGYLSPVNSIDWNENAGLLTGSADRSVKCWHPVELNNTVVWQLAWSTPMNFMVERCQMNHAKLSPSNAELLKQRGAVGEPAQLEEIKQTSSQKKSPWKKDIKSFKLSSFGQSFSTSPSRTPAASGAQLTELSVNRSQTLG